VASQPSSNRKDWRHDELCRTLNLSGFRGGVYPFWTPSVPTQC
jgi:hypothetical protein